MAQMRRHYGKSGGLALIWRTPKCELAFICWF
jgi:hypothetical protein